MHPKLVRLRDELARTIEAISADDLITRPADGKWSAAEILEHLNLTYVGTIRNLERRLQTGQPSDGTGRDKKRWPRIAVTQLGYFPKGRRSPERVMPRGTPPQQVITEIFENLSLMDALISQCEVRFPRGCAIADHPTLGPLTAAEWRGFHCAHGRHHAKQIRVLRAKMFTR